MKVLMVLGPQAGQVVEWDTPVAETLIGTGEAEAYTEAVSEVEPEEAPPVVVSEPVAAPKPKKRTRKSPKTG